MRWLLKLWIFVVGIRFYESKATVDQTDVIRSVFKTVDGRHITFKFYRETFRDKVFRFGRFTSVRTQAFVVQPDFDGLTDSAIIKFNKSRHYFWSQVLWLFSDEVVADVLLGLYLSFLEHHFRRTN